MTPRLRQKVFGKATEGLGQTQRTIEAVFRSERARLIGGLVRMTRSFDLAEDLAQDAMVAALAEWPRTGIPRNAGAWLMMTAKRRGIDAYRHLRMRDQKLGQLAKDEPISRDRAPTQRLTNDSKENDLLALIFTACHPVLSADARAALTLRIVGGLTTKEIARAFLSSEAAIIKRIARAKAAIEASALTFDVPDGAERRERLPSVLEVIYLVFNEGYASTEGSTHVRLDFAAEAQHLGRMLAELLPDEPEVFGLVALMALQASRFPARITGGGSILSLGEQDRALWDQTLIGEGLAALTNAQELRGSGPYVLQAAIAACHAIAPRADDTSWTRIAALYDRLLQATLSPVVELNRAVAHGMAFGPKAGLLLLEGITPERLPRYAPLPAAKGELLLRLGRKEEAYDQFLAAADLTGNVHEVAFLLARAVSCSAALCTDRDGPLRQA